MNRLFEGLSPLSAIGMGVILFGIVGVVVTVLVMLVRDIRDKNSGYATSSGWDGFIMPSYARDIQLPARRGRTIDSEIVVLPDDADLDDLDLDEDEDEEINEELRAWRAQLDAPYQDVAPLAPPIHPYPQPVLVDAHTTVLEHSSYHRTTTTYFAPEPVPAIHPLAVDPRDDILPWWYRLMSDSPTLDMKDMIVAPMPAPRTSHRREDKPVINALEFPTGQFSVMDLLAAVGSSAA